MACHPQDAICLADLYTEADYEPEPNEPEDVDDGEGNDDVEEI